MQPSTAEEERLRLCWTSADRPDRHFVPYTYVDACKIAGMLLKQIFTDNGTPITMHIHPSIANPNARSALSARIMVCTDGRQNMARILSRPFSTQVAILTRRRNLRGSSSPIPTQKFFTI